LFHRAIGQSGSAVSPWAFDFEPEFHARRIARKLECDLDEQSALVECMKNKTFTEITKAHSEYVVNRVTRGPFLTF
jgi:carboxylesterase type B